MLRAVRTASALCAGILCVIESLACTMIVQRAHATEQVGTTALAQQMLKAAGVRGGVIIHLGCGDGQLTAALRTGDSFLVQGLDADVKNIEAVRRHIVSLGLSGKVSVDAWHGSRLPYADNLANLIVVQQRGNVTDAELLRVLVPNGVAIFVDPQSAIRGPQLKKPWPKEMDEWTHYLHDASNNAVAHDRIVAAPRALQWVDGPLWSRSHEYPSSLCAMVSAEGRLFCIFDEGPTGIVDPRIPDRWKLIARDAFNGVVLWKRDLDDWGWKAWQPQLASVDWRRMPSQRTALPAGVARRLVAAGDRLYVTLGYQTPLAALAAATGETLLTYAGTERTDEIVHQDGRLVLRIGQSVETTEVPAGKKDLSGQKAGTAVLVALDAATGRRLWQTEPGAVVPLSLAIGGENVFFHDQNAVVCLDAASGKPRWRSETGRAGGSLTLVVYEKVVLCAHQKQLVALAAADGKLLWTLPGAKGVGVANPPDLFVADGLVWYGAGPTEPERVTGYDPLTGKPGRTVEIGPLITHGHHARCYRSKATDNYLLLPKRGVEFIDLHGDQHARNNWVRGACRYGVVPCNGLLYSTPHPCFCYAGVKLGGFLALSPQSKDEGLRAGDEDRLQRGSAYEEAQTHKGLRQAQPSGTETRSSFTGTPFPASDLQSLIPNPSDWPMYRHDPRRSGSTPAVVEGPVRPVWKTQLGGKLAQPVVVGDRLFVARVDAAQVCCLDAATGTRIWDYTVSGRVDSAPSYYRGSLIFGSADGWVYCLRASDGALVWRFRAAPDDRRVAAFGQIESAWPVHGSVLILDGPSTGSGQAPSTGSAQAVAYFAAGRSSFLDGGMFLYGLDPITGEKRYETRLDGPHPDIKVLDENAYAMEGAKSDILVTDGALIYLFHNALNSQLEKQPTPVLGAPGVRNLGERQFGEHLFSNAGFLDDSWFSRNHWMLGDQWTAFNFAHQAPKAGELLVFDDAHTYAAKCFLRRNLLSPLFFPATDGCFLVADRNATRPAVVNVRQQSNYIRWLPQEGELQKCWNLDVGYARGEPAEWVAKIPVRIRALVRTGNALVAAGPPDLCEPDDPLAALEGRRGAVLVTFDPRDGRKLHECKLDAAPALDGMSAAGGRLYMAALEGSVWCLGRD